jgi:poly(hydroxyalkanoate) depolymerase family esterase
MRSRKLLGLALMLAAVTPSLGRAQVQATIGGSAPVQVLPFDTVTPNPTGIKMYYYVPSSGTAPMPIVVASHFCEGHASDMLSWLKATAEAYGFMLVLPDANRVNGGNPSASNGCWDVGSDDTFANATATNPSDRSNSDPAGIYALVKWVGTDLMCGTAVCGDLTRVFATGQSSGAMMTSVLLGLYPDVFKAGAAAMGVPFKCWLAGVGGAHPTAGTNDTKGGAAGWSGSCAGGTVTHTAAEWAALLPAYTGTRPRMLLYHGESDDVISYVNLGEETKQLAEAYGVGQTPSATEVVAATKTSSGWTAQWTRKRFGGTGGQAPLETLTVAGVKHAVANPGVLAEELARFFDLGDKTAPAAPTDLAASAVTTEGATLTWTAPADTDVYNYVVSRVDGATLTAVGWPNAATKTVTLTGLSAETAYTFQVVAADKAGNASPAATVQFTTAKAPSTGGGGGGGCGQGVPSGAALLLAAAALLLVRRRASRA